jgi:excinuclease ABC subunit C
MKKELQEKLDRLPTEPGVYVMKDRSGEIIYVGKAVNLRSRVRSYFNPGSSDSRAFVALLDRLLGDLETLLVSNEKEALLLENELIKKHRPRFNIQLRDDKNYLNLRLDLTHPYPRLEMVRSIKKDGARYFGPYSSASSIRETLRTINRYFQLRTCSDHVLENRRRPCLLHQIGRCPAPCVFPIPREHYRRNVDDVMLFLEGKADELTTGIRARIKELAKDLRFEDAARVRDQLIAIDRSLERQKIAFIDTLDQDVFGFYREADRLLIYALYVRKGRITGGRSFPFTGQEFPDNELITSFVNLYYGEDNPLPDEVLLPGEHDAVELKGLSELLTERKGEKVLVLSPRRGEKVELVAMAARNAKQAFFDRKRSKEETVAILERLKDRLDLKQLPRRMECFDISHFQGSSIVASQVAMTDGEVDKSRYRRFKMKTVVSNDDFASMHEVITRRVKRGLAEDDLPDLLVIDGGKGQLASAMAALRDLGVEKLDVVALAKSRDLEVADRDEDSKRSPERVFLPLRKDPIVLPQSSPELFLLTRLRDEAHRFAITFQQKLQRKKNLKSVLEEIPGVGEGRKKALLRHFGSLKKIRSATIEALSEVEGLGPAVAERIHAHLHGTVQAVAEADQGDDAVREASLEDARTNEASNGGTSTPST